MIYVVSDLHGYPLERFKKLLALANFGKDDFLFILGDVIDRNGDGGVRMLIWLMMQDNAQLILGNHEIMLLSCDFLFDEITNETVNTLDPEKIDALRDYLICGGDVTIKNLQKLPKSTRRDILDYLMDCPLYETVSAGKRDFLLVHAGLKDFDPNKKMSDYSAHDLIWTRPGFNDFYFDDIITVFGHTPTVFYGGKYLGKTIRTRTWINIDVGAGGGEEPVLLRLDDLKEFQLEKNCDE